MMNVADLCHGTFTIAQAAERSLLNGTTTVAARAAPGIYQAILDLSDMVATDDLTFKVYEKVRGAAQAVIYSLAFADDVTPDIWVSPAFILHEGWDMTCTADTNSIVVTATIRMVEPS